MSRDPRFYDIGVIQGSPIFPILFLIIIGKVFLEIEFWL